MTHKFLPPESVNYTKPFRIEESSPSHHKATVTKQDDGFFKIEWDNGNSFISTEGEVGDYFDMKIWKLLDELVEKPLGEFFKFETKQGTCVCTYTKQASGNPVITWAGISTTRYTEKDCRDNIESGEWTVLPSESTNTAEQAFEDAFSAVECMIKPAAKASTEGLLETIKHACTSTDGRINVWFTGTGYLVYLNDVFDDGQIVPEDDLEEVLKALSVLDSVMQENK